MILGALFFGKKILFPNEIDLIKKQLSFLEKIVSYDKPLAPLAMLSRSNKLKKVLNTSVTISIQTENISKKTIKSIKEVTQALFMLTKYANTFDLDFVDSKITVDDNTAQVNTTIRGIGTKSAGKDFYEAAEVIIFLAKINGKWLITKIQTVEVIS